MLASLPGQRVNKLINLIGSTTRSDLPLKIVNAPAAISPTDRDARRPKMHRLARDARQSHHSCNIEIGVVCRAENFDLTELMPAAAQLIDERSTESMRPRRRIILRTAEVIALIMAPVRNSGFKGIVENVAARDSIFRRETMIDARGVIVLPRDGAPRSIDEI